MLYSLDTCNTNVHNKNMVKYIHNQQINIKSYINIFHR